MAMIERTRENHRCLRVGFGKQLIETRGEKIGVEIKESAVTRRQFTVRLHNTDQLNIMSVLCALNKIADRIVSKADDCETDGRFCILALNKACHKPEKENHSKFFH